MRVTTAFNRILALPGASVATVSFTDQGLVLGLRRRRRRRLVCPPAAGPLPLRQLPAPVAAPGLRDLHGVPGGPGAPYRVPGPRAGAYRAGAVGSGGCLAYPRLRGRGGLVGDRRHWWERRCQRKGSLMEANTHVCSPSGNGHGSSRRPSGQLVDTDRGRQIHCLRRFISGQPTARPWERSRAG